MQISMIVGMKPAQLIGAKRFRDAVRLAVEIREKEGWDTISLKVLQRRGVYVNEAPLTWRRTDPEAARIEGRA